MIEQVYNYLDEPVQAMAEFFETRTNNLEKSIPPSVTSRSRKKNKNNHKKRKALTYKVSEEGDPNKDE